MGTSLSARKTALFVDFDNIYLSLRDSERRAAERFAMQPDRWLNWFAKGNHDEDDVTGEAEPSPRSILVRRCYLSPHAFGEFRPYFTRAGFSVIDCPALTGRGKNSADIVMVMDILDSLEHTTRFDEFIILSGDADFTPVLLRLRAHDRRTVVVTNALTAAAYRAASDMLVDQETFVEDALGVDEAQPRSGSRSLGIEREAPVALSVESLADRAVQYLRQHGRVPPAELIPIFKQHPSFTSDSRWLGFGTLRKLCERLAEVRPEITIEGIESNVWTIGLTDAAPGATAPAIQPDATPRRREQVIGFVKEQLAASTRPIDLANLGKIINRMWPGIKDADWEGAGTLREFFRSANDPRLVVHNTGSGSTVVYDPQRHMLPESPTGEPGKDGALGSDDRFQTLPRLLVELIDKVGHVTGCPRLSPEQYRFLFKLIAEYDFGPEFNQGEASADLRDMARERGNPISRASINFVLTAFRFRRYDMAAPNKDPKALATIFKRNVMDLSRNASLPLSLAELDLLDQWFGSEPETSADGSGGDNRLDMQASQYSDGAERTSPPHSKPHELVDNSMVPSAIEDAPHGEGTQTPQ